METTASTDPEEVVSPSLNGSRRSFRRPFGLEVSSTSPTQLEAALGIALSGVGWALWSIPVFRDSAPLDLGLAYQAGNVAWATGHPERLATWISTPFLAMMMAFISRLVTLGHAAVILNLVNVLILVAMTGGVWWGIRTRISRWYWWGSLVTMSAFAPAISTMWWKQFNLIGLGLAVLGFWLMRRHRTLPWLLVPSFIIALSISVKPVAVLVILALLARRDSRLGGILTAAWAILLEVIAQVFLAIRSHSLSTLNPIPAYDNFSKKALPANIWVCHPENFSPQSILCRMGGTSYWTAQRIAVLLGVLVLCLLASSALRRESGYSWRVFAYGCALSPMISPIAWSHYQVMLAPLLVASFFDFARHRANTGLWAAMAAGYALCELVWRPYGTLPGAIAHFFTHHVETTATEFTVFSYAAWAQFVIVGVAIAYFGMRTREQEAEGRRQSGLAADGAADQTDLLHFAHAEQSPQSSSISAGGKEPD